MKLTATDGAFIEQAIIEMYDQAVLDAGPAGLTDCEIRALLKPRVKAIIEGMVKP